MTHKLKNALFQRLNFDAQDAGMINMRNKEIGKKLQSTCTILWKELNSTTNISDELVSRLDSFHNDVEQSAKQTGLYK
ncbi:hypothetical protein [Providencia sp. PROV130]|uniref:hypothetical protein n=1 Tax=Providencia sp. PROV130 TaxID=2949840 RepID=UPI00234B4BB5|nr:hypothetical protein [Providencia sp. PROV130]